MSWARRSVLLLLAAAMPALGPAEPTMAQGTPATVTVQVEGDTGTLVAKEAVTTSTEPLEEAGVPCSGTSVAGALERATGGAWSTDGQSVTSIRGEAHPGAADTRRWVLAVNSVPTEAGPCALELNAGDTVLLYTSPSFPPASCRTNGRDGNCGTPDRTAPSSQITSIIEQERFTRATAPLVLQGRSVDPSGIADVRLRLTRVIGTSRCAAFDGIEDAFRRLKPCRSDGGRFFSIGSAARWSWSLPARLTRGRYTLDVQAVDTRGNASGELARGQDRVVFTVR